MPRGRKGPPQESIDSILLAISHRDDLDATTLSHYFARLDEAWTQGAREKVLHLFRTNDSAAHAAAILILSELATDFDREELEDFVADPTVSDIAKLTLSPILKELDSAMAEEGIIEYLNDPAAAMQQMQMRLLELAEQGETGIEAILEDVIAMPTERRLGFVSWLGSSNDPRAAHLLVPLLESQSGKVASAVVEALEQLGPIALAQTVPALNYMLTMGSNGQAKQQARAALDRLATQSLPGAQNFGMMEILGHPLPPHAARASLIDGSGTQLIMLSWQRPDGLLKGVNVLYQDEWGIKDCYGVDEMTVDRWVELMNSLDEKNFGSFHVPFEYGCALIAEARALNKRTHRKLPIAYAIWRPLIEGLPTKNAVPTMLPSPDLTADTIALAQHGDELYKILEFASWMYEPITTIEPYMTRYWSLFSTLNTSGRRASTRKTKSKAKDPKVLLEELIDEALDMLVDEKWCAIYEARLRRQAALFHFADREQESTLIAAVAAVLHPDSQVPIQEQAFPRALIRVSIEQGPIRMMTEALDAASPSLTIRDS